MNIFRKLPYFAAAGLPSPLTHLWFLALVMQFYLVWPLLIMAIGRLVRAEMGWTRRDGDNRACVERGDVAAVRSRRHVARVLRYGYEARGAGDGGDAGDADAACRPPPTHRKQRDDGRGASAIILDVFGWLSLLALCAGFWFMNGYDDTMYHGGYLVAAILGAFIAGAIRGVSLPRVLGCAPLRYLGSRSYSLYLMHYPLLQFINPATRTEALPWWGWLVEAAVIWTATEAFYQLVEATRMYEPTPRSRHARASVEPSGRLRPGSWVMAALGIVTVAALTWAPVNWEQIAHDRMIQLRPNSPSRRSLSPCPNRRASKSPRTTARRATMPRRIRRMTMAPQPERKKRKADVSICHAHCGEGARQPGCLPKYHYDPEYRKLQRRHHDDRRFRHLRHEGCDPGGSNGYINGKPNRQMPQAVSVFQQETTAGHSGSVIIFYGLGTNGIIRNEQVVQQLIDLAGGKPVYFVTIHMPYPNQEKNNNSMMRAAASHNGNVGIIDFGTSTARATANTCTTTASIPT